jgi:hypothetical protein
MKFATVIITLFATITTALPNPVAEDSDLISVKVSREVHDMLTKRQCCRDCCLQGNPDNCQSWGTCCDVC